MDRRQFIKSAAAVSAAAGAGCITAGGTEKLALFGGKSVISQDAATQAKRAEMFAWPIVNDAMRKASDDVLKNRAMSKTDIAKEFEAKFAEWNGAKYALCTLNGTTALNTAFWVVGVGPGDEVICPSITMWASCSGVVNIGGTVVFCDVKPDDLTVDPVSFEKHITPRTKAIVVVHYMGSPCDMDPIMKIARKHNIKVIEDVSHAQGGLYKGRKLGTIGDIGAMSLMSSKSFAIGEGGMFITDNEHYWHRAIQWSSYARFKTSLPPKMWEKTLNIPLGGIKNRLNQCTCAVGLEQLKKYDRERAEIEEAMLYYHSLIKDVKGLNIIYPKYEKSNKAGWYASRCKYDPEVFGVDNKTFVAALNAETGGGYTSGCNFPMHWSSVYNDEDIFGNGLPPVSRYLPKGVTPKALTGTLPVADKINDYVFGDPWFKHFDKPMIEQYAEAVHKVAANVAQLKGYDSSKLQHTYW